MEQNGTFDMMGNVREWNETLIGSNRGLRGGSYGSAVATLESSYRVNNDPGNEYSTLGFRVASVPEPVSLVLLSLGGLALRRRKK
jgi:formylglycine-generating enzyme required for sulfatase activity